MGGSGLFTLVVEEEETVEVGKEGLEGAVRVAVGREEGGKEEAG